MKRELEQSLRHIQQNPSTGEVFNSNLLTTQVQAIFKLDELNESIKKLTSAIKKSDQQSQHLEASNYRLQIAMFVITLLGTSVVIYGPI